MDRRKSIDVAFFKFVTNYERESNFAFRLRVSELWWYDIVTSFVSRLVLPVVRQWNYDKASDVFVRWDNR